MKAKAVAYILLVLTIGMAVVLVLGYQRYEKEFADLRRISLDFSNNFVRASQNVHDLEKVNIELETRVTNSEAQVEQKNKELAASLAKMAKNDADAQSREQSLKAEVEKREKKISDLETQKVDLTKRMTELDVTLKTLEDQIADTQKKLAASEGDREFLLKELKRLQAEKLELEKQFNNLAFMREQVRKLRDELSIARRLEWLRQGLYGKTQKGGEKLQQGFAQGATGATNANLNVELHDRGGEYKILRTPTNAPPSTAPKTNAPPNK